MCCPCHPTHHRCAPEAPPPPRPGGAAHQAQGQGLLPLSYRFSKQVKHIVHRPTCEVSGPPSHPACLPVPHANAFSASLLPLDCRPSRRLGSMWSSTRAPITAASTPASTVLRCDAMPPKPEQSGTTCKWQVYAGLLASAGCPFWHVSRFRTHA